MPDAPNLLDGWFNPMRGGFPRMPSRDVLPPASDDLRGQLLLIRGTPDVPYICLADASGAYRWVPFLSGAVQRTYPTAISNDSTEKTLLSYTVPAGALGLAGSVEFEMRGQFLNSSGSPVTVEPRVKWGGTTIWDDSNGVASAAGPHAWVFRGRITNLGAANSQAFDGDSIVSGAAAAVTGIGPFGTGAIVASAHRSASDPAKDTTAAVALLVTMQLGTASASAVWTTDYADVWLR